MKRRKRKPTQLVARQVNAILRPGGLMVLRDEVERTTQGDSEDARRWRGAKIWCSECGRKITGVIVLHKCGEADR